MHCDRAFVGGAIAAVVAVPRGDPMVDAHPGGAPRRPSNRFPLPRGYVQPFPPHLVMTAGGGRILPHGDGTFGFPEDPDDGVAARWLVVSDRFGEMVDLVAWQAVEPWRWWLHRGGGVLAGAEWRDHCIHNGEILVLLETPLDWARARGRGACLLAWDADPRRVFDGVPEVRCATRALAARLAARIAALSAPPFRVSVAGAGEGCDGA
jgi:hypothetical protein